DETRAALARMRAAGATVRVVADDVARPGAIDAALAALPADRPLRGVIHAAGVLDDAPLLDLTPARLGAVFAPKVAGALALHHAVAGRDLDFFVLYGSFAAWLGAAAQAAYTAANAFLIALAHARRAAGLVATCLDWGGFSEMGMAARLAAPLRDRMPTLSPAEGLVVLERVIAHDVTELIATSTGEVMPEAALFAELRDARPQAAGPTDLRARLLALDADGRVEALLDYLQALVARALGLDPAAPMALDRPFIDLGVDSLMSIEIRNTVARALDERLSATTLFEHPTINQLARWLSARLAPPDAPPPTPPAPEPQADGLDALSEAELAAILLAELGGEDE
ncbi:MAG: KR domain-containing protein, partial [Myxococcales bacterium]|nr:KR domain-containing protein [Myxococcales bacterium]